MRLLNTAKIQFEDFFDSTVPCYAILSHTWGSEEVSFKDMQTDQSREKAGFAKIESCCAQAAIDGWSFVWIDACCIDKTSSVELSEAINSMFEWYRKAAVCYAYLEDVPEDDTNHKVWGSAFRRSRWFTRGWTLQELLAPSNVVFFNKNWKEIGTRSTLSPTISLVTSITLAHLVNSMQANVGTKMSWASARETTRMEDSAYCLLGLFGVNMPLLYGEGRNAFLRLQLAILAKSDDETIFAWDRCPTSGAGMLAPSPAVFARSGDVRQVFFDRQRPPYSMTNKGLRMELHLAQRESYETKSDQDHGRKVYAATLNCGREYGNNILMIYLRSDDTFEDGVQNVFTRCSVIESHGGSQSFETWRPDGSIDFSKPRTVVYVKQLDWNPGERKVPQRCHFLLKYPRSLCEILGVRSRQRIVLDGKVNEEHGRYMIQLDEAEKGAVVFGIRNRRDEVGFVILLEALPNDSAAINIFVFINLNTQNMILASLNNSAGLRLSEDQTENVKQAGPSKYNLEGEVRPEDHVQQDRISRVLPSRTSVSVALKPMGYQGQKRFLIDVTFGLDGDIQWPSPAIQRYLELEYRRERASSRRYESDVWDVLLMLEQKWQAYVYKKDERWNQHFWNA